MPSPPTYPKITRIAAIEIRAVNQTQYDAIIEGYKAYGVTPFDIPTGVSFESGDKEVRVVLAPDTLSKGNLAIVYWQVPGANEGDITKTYGDWKTDYKYYPVEAPSKNGILMDVDSEATYSGVLKEVNANAKTESQFGIVINPPYPRFHDYEGGGPRFTDTGHSTGLVSVLGVLLTLATGGGIYSWRKFRTLKQCLVQKGLWPVQ